MALKRNFFEKRQALKINYVKRLIEVFLSCPGGKLVFKNYSSSQTLKIQFSHILFIRPKRDFSKWHFLKQSAPPFVDILLTVAFMIPLDHLSTKSPILTTIVSSIGGAAT